MDNSPQLASVIIGYLSRGFEKLNRAAKLRAECDSAPTDMNNTDAVSGHSFPEVQKSHLHGIDQIARLDSDNLDGDIFPVRP